MLMPSVFGRSLFDEFFDAPYGAYHTSDLMRTDVKETDRSYEVTMDLPGVKKEDVKAELKDGTLTIHATTNYSNDQKDQNGRYIRRERYAGSMSRSFYVGDVKPEDVSAKFEDGILKLDLPKAGQRRLPENNRICIE